MIVFGLAHGCFLSTDLLIFITGEGVIDPRGAGRITRITAATRFCGAVENARITSAVGYHGAGESPGRSPGRTELPDLVKTQLLLLEGCDKI